MINVFFRSNGVKNTLLNQESSVCQYAKLQSIRVDTIFTEFSAQNQRLEDRSDIKSFMDSLKDNDTLLIYDLCSLSSYADELVKMFTCLFKKSISVHIVLKDVVVNKESSSFLVLGMINEVREESLKDKIGRSYGRPKGRISKSIFDDMKNEIISLIQEKKSVSAIARELDVNRSSLKDYINSRGLKEMIISKQSNFAFEFDKNSGVVKILDSIECPFQKEKELLK